MRKDPSFALILLCFFLSGVAGLVFETLWTREFALVFGTSELAVATVLAAYMGGLAVGASVARRWVLRTTRPILVYGFLELGIGLGALAVPLAIRGSQVLCVALFGDQPSPPDGDGFGLSLFTLLSAFVILLVPTAFMGATLPLLTRFAVRSDEEIGRRIALLYAINTAGAVTGVLATAFWLLPDLGLGQVLWVGVAINVSVFVLACFAASRAKPSTEVDFSAAAATPASARDSWILPLILLSGVTSFTYEVLWVRLLGHILGGTVYAFGTMLASFLTGIALGSALASKFASTRDRALFAFPISQIGVAFCSLGAFLAVNLLPGLALSLGAGSGAGAFRNAAVAALALLPGALFIGASFPLAVRILARRDTDASPASARVYAWNTLGAIIGSVGSGFVWIPLLHFHGAVAAAIAVNLAIAAMAAWLATPRDRTVAAVSATALLALLLLRPGPPWEVLMTSSLDIVAGRSIAGNPDRVSYFAVGRSSTVILRTEPDGSLGLLTNGLPEASVRPRGATLMDNTVTWLSGFPLLARPEARSLLVIGLGTGGAIERVPDSIESIDVIELEVKVVEANRHVAEVRASDPLSDPRVRIAVNDARGSLQLTSRRWDVIVSQPSHPWTAGASHLFTQEFFELTREHLTEGGVVVQWLSPAFMDAELLRSLLATIRTVFEHVELYWIPREEAVFFLASDVPIDMLKGAARRLARSPHDFAHLGVHAPEDVLAYLAADDEGTRRLAVGAPLTTDARNLLQFRAPQVLRDPLSPDELSALLAEFDPLVPVDATLDSLRLARRLAATQQQNRAQRVGESSTRPGTREAIRGMLALRAGERLQAVTDLRRAVALDPALREAWVALTRKQLAGKPVSYFLSARHVPTYPELAAVADGWDRVVSGNWDGLRQLDSTLAAIGHADPTYPDALRLRAFWRIASEDASLGAEAVSLLDDLLPMSHQAVDAVLRTRALRVSGDADAALAILAAILQGLDPSRAENFEVIERISAALAEYPRDGPGRERREIVANALMAKRFEMRQR